MQEIQLGFLRLNNSIRSSGRCWLLFEGGNIVSDEEHILIGANTVRYKVSDGAGSPRLLHVREPDQFGVERTHPQLAFGARLVELAKPNRHVAANDNRAPASLDHDDLHAACVPRRRDEPEPGKQFEFAIDRYVLHARRIDPLANGVVVLVARVVELATLDVDRLAGKEVVAAAVVEVQVCVNDDVDAARSKFCVLSGWRRGSISATAGCSSVMPVSTSTRASGWSMTCT